MSRKYRIKFCSISDVIIAIYIQMNVNKPNIISFSLASASTKSIKHKKPNKNIGINPNERVIDSILHLFNPF